MTIRNAVGACVVCAAVCGCMDGPFYAMKHLNPIARKEWKQDQQLGPTFDDRMEEMDRLASRLSSLTPEQQEFWGEQLARLIEKDPSPIIRARATELIAQIPSSHTIKALNLASADDSLRVRLTVCRAWRQHAGNEARDMLLSMAVADNDSSVRQAAITALQDFKDPEVVRTLGNLLDDPSPAIQIESSRTLAAITGEPLGQDIQQWKQYVAQNFAPSPQADHFEGLLVRPASTSSQ